ncbi:MAG: AzlD domain-containing protein, partial [Thermoleophilaceae bacterium]|nr:AzlD domain-containing protein [Thermoleophilaceae bacterium]
MTEVWITIAGLVVTTVAIKAAGPVIVGGRELPRGAYGVISLLAPALLTALILTDTFAREQDLTVDARAAGLACAG